MELHDIYPSLARGYNTEPSFPYDRYEIPKRYVDCPNEPKRYEPKSYDYSPFESETTEAQKSYFGFTIDELLYVIIFALIIYIVISHITLQISVIKIINGFKSDKLD